MVFVASAADDNSRDNRNRLETTGRASRRPSSRCRVAARDNRERKRDNRQKGSSRATNNNLCCHVVLDFQKFVENKRGLRRSIENSRQQRQHDNKKESVQARVWAEGARLSMERGNYEG